MSEQNENRNRPSGSRPSGTHTSANGTRRPARPSNGTSHTQGQNGQRPKRRPPQGQNGQGAKRPSGSRPNPNGSTSRQGSRPNPNRVQAEKRPERTGTAPKGKTTTKKQRKKRRVILYVVEVIILLLVLAALFVWTKLNKIHKADDMSKEELMINELDSETKELLSGYTNIALFGLDNRSNGDFDTGRSDCIIIASINNDTKEVRLVSVYRDTFLNMSDDTYSKANAAYAKGGPKQAVAMLNMNLDLNIEDYVAVDFNAVADCVDALGGITLEVTDEEAAIMNGETGHQDYIGEIEQVTGKKSSHLKGGGTYNLDGVQATAYARIRYTAGDDYRRALRQRTVLTKMIEKAKKADVSTLNKIVNSVFDEVSTTYSNTEIISMAAYLQSYELVDTAGFPYYKNTGSVGKQGDCVIPCDLEQNVISLHEYLFADETYTPSNTVTGISQKIVSKTGYNKDSAVKTSDPTEENKTESQESTEETSTKD